MVVQCPCFVCNKAVAKNHRAVQCDLCDSWVHIAFNSLIHIKNSKKTSLSGTVWAVFERSYHMGWSMIQSWETYDTHRQAIVSPNSKIISSIIKQSEHFDEEILKRQTIGFIHMMILTLHGKASVWYHNCSVCTSTYPLCLITTLSYIIYFPILELNQIQLDYLKLGFKGGSNQLPTFLFQTMFMNIPQLNQKKGRIPLYFDKKHKIQAA